MKAYAAVVAFVAVAASGSAPTLTGPFSFVNGPSFVDGPTFGGHLSVPNIATPVSTQSSNVNATSASTSASTSTVSLDRVGRPLEWVRRPIKWATLVREDASTSDLGPAAAAATTTQMTTPTLTRDVSVVPTVQIRGIPDGEEKLRSIFSGRGRGGSSVTPVADPAATLRIKEHQDVLRTMTKTTRTTQGERPSVTPNPRGTMRGEEILELLRAESKKRQQQQQQQQTPTWDVESRPTVEHVEDGNNE